MNVSAVTSQQSGSVTHSIKSAANATGSNFDYLLKQANIESSLNPNARAAKSSALGLYQFTDSTWLKMVKDHGASHGLESAATALKANTLSAEDRAALLDMRRNPELATRMAAEFAADNSKVLTAAGKKDIGAQDLYLAHFLGGAGAVKFLNGLNATPDAPAANALPSAAQSNQAIFFPNGQAASFSDIYARFQSKFAGMTAPSAATAQLAQSVLEKAGLLPNSLLSNTPQTLNTVDAAAASQNAATVGASTSNPALGSVPVSADAMGHFLQSFEGAETAPDLEAVDSSVSERGVSEGATNVTSTLDSAEINRDPFALSLDMGPVLDLRDMGNHFKTFANDPSAMVAQSSPSFSETNHPSTFSQLADVVKPQVVSDIAAPLEAVRTSSILFMPFSASRSVEAKTSDSMEVFSPKEAPTSEATTVAPDPSQKSRQWVGLWSLAPSSSRTTA